MDNMVDVKLTYEANIAFIKIEGPINSDSSHLFGEKLDEIIASEVTLVEFDFSTCRNISSSGIGKLLLFYREFIKRDGEIEIVKSSPTVYEIFTTIKLNQLFTINL